MNHHTDGKILFLNSSVKFEHNDLLKSGVKIVWRTRLGRISRRNGIPKPKEEISGDQLIENIRGVIFISRWVTKFIDSIEGSIHNLYYIGLDSAAVGTL